MRTRIKVCGLTREADVDAAVEAGVDALGFVFYAASPRAVSAERAQVLARRVPAWVSLVGLFVNAPRSEILKTADLAGLSHLQLHGNESPEDCSGLGRPVIKALRIRPVADAAQRAAEQARLSGLVAQFSGCAALLLDTDSSGFGGSGQSFDWQLVGPELRNDPMRSRTWVLSGGLESDSVGRAVSQLQPACVDVSSGVERLEGGVVVKGQKDAQRIREFVAAVNAADVINMEKT
jgi:phosphoribosylanthranilate isomerase